MVGGSLLIFTCKCWRLCLRVVVVVVGFLGASVAKERKWRKSTVIMVVEGIRNEKERKKGKKNCWFKYQVSVHTIAGSNFFKRRFSPPDSSISKVRYMSLFWVDPMQPVIKAMGLFFFCSHL
jgi:hypothetical protein